MTLFNDLYLPTVKAYAIYCESLAALAKEAKCNFRIAAWGSARKATPITQELAASWTRRGWDTVTGGGPGQMHFASLGAYEERSLMIRERAHVLHQDLLEANLDLAELDEALFDEAEVASAHLLDPDEDEFDGLKIEEKAGRYVRAILLMLRMKAVEFGVEAKFDEATYQWESELRKYTRKLAKIFSCSLYFPSEPPNQLADQVLLALDFPSRLRFFEALCSAFVILPFGGIGTLLELMLALQWVQLLGDKRNLEKNPGMLPINGAVQAGYMPPIIVMNREMYDHLRALLIELCASGTINKEDIDLLQLATTVDEVNIILDAAYEQWLAAVACDIKLKDAA